MRNTILAATGLGALLVLSGCTILIDTDQYLPPDGAPTQPEIRIVPENPTTVDDLRVEFVTDSTGGPGDVVNYEYHWRVDGAESSQGGDGTIPSDATTKGQTWQVEVTPSVNGLPGPKAVASVEVANSRPVVGSLGLDTYFPAVGDVVSVEFGEIFDADGDPTGKRTQWYVNGSEVNGATFGTLDTATLKAGDELEVEGWGVDQESEGDKRRVGPVKLAPGGPHWRPVEPDRWSDGPPRLVYDARNDRLVGMNGGLLWEYTEREGHLQPRAIPVTGELPPDAELVALAYDAAHERVYFIPFDDSVIELETYELDVSRPGRESWRKLDPLGTPPKLLFPNTTFDASNRTLWVCGLNGTAPENYVTELWSLKFDDVSATWTKHPLVGEGVRVAYGAFAVDPTNRDRLFYLGGLDFASGFQSASPRVLSFTLDGGDALVEEHAPLESGRAGSFAVSDAKSGTILIVGGGRDIGGQDVLAPPTLLFTPTTAQVQTYPGLPRLSVWGSGAVAEDGTFTFFPGPEFSSEQVDTVDAYRFDPSTEDGPALKAANRRPLGVAQAHTGFVDGELIVAGGRVDYGALGDRVWAYEVDQARWREVMALPDPRDQNTVPALSAGVSSTANDGWDRNKPLWIFSGVDANGTPIDTEVWELEGDTGTTWLHRKLKAGEAVPSQREGAAVFSLRGTVGQVLGMFGGEVSGNYISDGAVLRCDSPDELSECSWSKIVPDPVLNLVDQPKPRSWSAVAVDDSHAWILGGRSTGGVALADLWVLPMREAGFVLRRPNVSGALPSARYGHSLTLNKDPGRTGVQLVLFGGGNDASTSLNDVVLLNRLGTGYSQVEWTVPEIVGAARPAPRRYHAAFWRDDRLVVVGGQSGDYDTPRCDVWELVGLP